MRTLSYFVSAATRRLPYQRVVARTNVAPAVVTGALRSAIADIDRDVPVSRMKTQTEQIQESLSTEFAFTRLLLAFAGFALFLACIGLHGLTGALRIE